MKKILILFTVLLLGLSSCQTQKNILKDESRFGVVEIISNGHLIVYDKYEFVMYDMTYAGLYPLYDTVGRHLIYNPEKFKIIK